MSNRRILESHWRSTLTWLHHISEVGHQEALNGVRMHQIELTWSTRVRRHPGWEALVTVCVVHDLNLLKVEVFLILIVIRWLVILLLLGESLCSLLFIKLLRLLSCELLRHVDLASIGAFRAS